MGYRDKTVMETMDGSRFRCCYRGRLAEEGVELLPLRTDDDHEAARQPGTCRRGAGMGHDLRLT